MNPHSGSASMQKARRNGGWQNMYNRSVMKEEQDYPMRCTFDGGLGFWKRMAGTITGFCRLRHLILMSPSLRPRDASPVI